MDSTKVLCEELRRSVDEIVLGWVAKVQADPYLRADDPLSLTQLVDHVPQMLEELCGLLSQGGEPDFKQVRAASTHGYTRSLEGYTLTELLRELELLPVWQLRQPLPTLFNAELKATDKSEQFI